MARKVTSIKVRLNLKIDTDLRDWAVGYAHRHGKTVTAIICECLQILQLEEERTQSEFVEQI